MCTAWDLGEWVAASLGFDSWDAMKVGANELCECTWFLVPRY